MPALDPGLRVWPAATKEAMGGHRLRQSETQPQLRHLTTEVPGGIMAPRDRMRDSVIEPLWN